MEISSACRCCLMRPPVKKLKQPYRRLGTTEIYSNMLKECFEIHLTFLPSDDDGGICKKCVSRLRDASNFKLQVKRSQEKLQEWLKEAYPVKEEEDLPKPEKSEADTDNAIQEDLLNVSVEVKSEPMVDPLPIEDDEDFKDFMADLESHVQKPEPQFEDFEAPALEETPLPFSNISARSKVFDESITDVKPKEEQKCESLAKNKASHSCDTCGRQFNRRADLNIHKKIHKKSSYICKICNKVFKWKCRLERHNIIHSGDKPYRCDICEKRFLSKYSWIAHKNVHTGAKPYGCDLCGNRYGQKQYLVLHLKRKHTELKHFKCKLCPLKFYDRKSFRSHCKINHATGTCICDVCKKTFRYKTELVTHLNIHFKWKIYTCDICGSNLSTLGSLRRHKIVHTDKKPYSCELCNKQFSYKHDLLDHKLTHTGEKPHCCEICGKRFGLKKYLKTHQAIHVEGQIYACELCTKSYSTSEGLRQHRRTHTNNKSQSKIITKNRNKKISRLNSTFIPTVQ